MKALSTGRRATVVAFLGVFLSGCAASQTQSLPQGAPYSQAIEHSTRSRVGPGSSGSDLLYISGYSVSKGATTFVLTYPAGKLISTLPLAAYGMCTDASGNVYMTNENAVVEYPHGGTSPVRTVRIPGAQTMYCSVDPTTGDLAVTFDCPPCGYENLAIFPPGSTTSTRYTAPEAIECAYDSNGNLFLVGYGGGQLAELPAGSSSFTTINLNKDIPSVGQLRWDGSYITLQSLETPTEIYRISTSGSVGTIVGETKFNRYMKRVGYSWISGGTVALPFTVHGNEPKQIGIWKYPNGGHASSIIKKVGTGDTNFGALTVSVAPSR